MLRSAFVLGLAALLLAVEPRVRGRVRPAVVGLTLAILMTGAILWPLPPATHAWMGDIGSYAGHRDRFDHYTDDQVWFSSHLAFFVLDGIDRLRGMPEDPAPAFDVLSWGAGVLSSACLFALAWYERWSARAIRYVALSIGAAQMLSYFGYRELGYLALNPAAYPLLDLGSAGNDRRLIAASGALFGLGAAFHGFGLIGLAGGAAAVIASRLRWSHLIVFLVAGAVLWLGWLAVYELTFPRPMSAGHAASLPIRGLFSQKTHSLRIVEPLFSVAGVRSVAASLLIVGAPVLLLSFAAARKDSTVNLRRIWAFGAISLVALVAFWPVQGIAYELDLIFAVFPATYVGLWVAARRGRLSAAACVVLAIAHVVFWRVAGAGDFDSPFLTS